MSARKPGTVAAKLDSRTTPPLLLASISAIDGSSAEAELSATEGGGEAPDATIVKIDSTITTNVTLARAVSPSIDKTDGQTVVEDRVSPSIDTTPKTPTPSDGTSKVVRVTRHSSPHLLLSSPVSSAGAGTGSGSGSGATRRMGSASADDGGTDAQSDGEEPSCSSLRKTVSERVTPTSASTIRGRKSLKDFKEAKEAVKMPEEIAIKEEPKDVTELEVNQMPEEKDHKDTKDNVKPDKEKEPQVAAASICNRVTRKTHAQEMANITRVTRNRRQSSTIATEPQLPARGRRKKAVPVESVAKRKRSEDDPEISLKNTKVEVKPLMGSEEDARDATEDVESVASLADDVVKEALNIKQEPHDSDDTSSPAVTPTLTGCRRGRGRPQGKHLLSSSPATRATRHSKAGSPVLVAVEPAPPKRRRVGSTNRSILPTKTASTSSLATSSHGAGDEDSKDSMASSMDDLLLAASDIKQEKLTPEFDENLMSESLDSAKFQQINQTAKPVDTDPSTSTTIGSNGHQCVEPLTVDTETTAIRKKSLSPEPAKQSDDSKVDESVLVASLSDSEKAPSLSPELISEGVSAISVKKFYKKPEFLANNLGIEKDPELGEIVQIVSSSSVPTHTDPDTENEPEAEAEVDQIVDQVTETETDELQAIDNEAIPANSIEAEEADEDEGKLEIDLEPKLDDSFSNTSIKTGELHLEDSSDEPDDVSLTTAIKTVSKIEMNTESIVVNGVKTDSYGVDEKLLKSPIETENPPSEKQEVHLKADHDDSNLEEFDTIESEIIRELVKEGVVDAKGNALSTIRQEIEQKSVPADVEVEPAGEEETLEEAPSNVSVVVDMERSAVENTTEIPVVETNLEMDVEHLTKFEAPLDKSNNADLLNKDAKEVLAEHIKTEQSTDCPEENKENLSTPASSQEPMEIELQVVVRDPKLGDDTEHKIEDKMPKAEDFEDPVVVENDIDIKNGCSNGCDNKPKDDLCSMDSSCDEKQRLEKERHLQNLGLLTHQAAEQLRQGYIQEASTRAAQQQQQQHHQQHSSKRQASKGSSSATHVESSGTLKTVIKLNRGSHGGASGTVGVPTGTVIHGTSSMSNTRQSKGGNSAAAQGARRQSLKMTFQKGRARGHGNADRSTDQQGAHGEDYYTIQNENEGATKSRANLHSGNVASAAQDSSHSEGHGQGDHGYYQTVSNAATCSKKDEKEKILIPEKASSFKFHPGRLCEDQCYYCSGKFGLYDTPCHVGQIKSVERQQKILANEEKLTVDNCLCDACFRHVDRRANAPSYKKRLSAPGHLETGSGDKHYPASGVGGTAAVSDGTVCPNEEEFGANTAPAIQRCCTVKDCAEPAAHSLRRKCIKKSVKRYLLGFEIPSGTSNVWLCSTHYNTVIQYSGCVLCKRRLGKNHMYHITSDTHRLEKALYEMGIPVQLGIGTAVCKLCRYFANLLMKPPDSTKSAKTDFVKNYRKKLLKFHNIQDDSNEASEVEEEEHPAESANEEMPAATVSASVTAASEDAEMVVDYDGPTDSNSSNSSSITPLGNSASSSSKQISKLQAILQQNLGNSAGGSGTSETSGSGSGSGSSSSNSNANTNVGGKGKASADISNVLRSNPNISMRELFHGEEDLGVHFKVPFGSSNSQRTPEGWTRVQTFLQYDEPTRRLWEELQKPYGNQSSFLRHLILLEKYYRNGDLVLAPHASPNATVYTETVRQRLNSFDHGHCGGLVTAKPPASHPPAATTSNSGSGNSVLASALTASPPVNVSAAETQDLTAEPTIPLVELNDDDDDEEDSRYANESPPKLFTNASVDKLTKQLSSNAVTITARPKESAANKPVPTTAEESTPKTSQSGTKDVAVIVPFNAQTGGALPLASSASAAATPANSRSILKANLLGTNKSVEIVPLSNSGGGVGKTANTTSTTNTTTNTSTKTTNEKQQKILEVAKMLLGMDSEANKQPKAVSGTNQTPATISQHQSAKPPSAPLLTSPPELISLQRRRTSNASGSGTGAGSTLQGSNVTAKRLQLPRVGAHPTGSTTARVTGGAPPPPPNVIILPDTLTLQERHESKSWKPTLIPLEDQHKVPNKSPALYQTADGRRLPALVQVQSGGKPYLISIFDYNRMCILRREKLRDQMLKANAKSKPGQNPTNQQGALSANSLAAAGFSNMYKYAQQTARQQLQQLQQHKQQQQHHHHQQQQQQQQQQHQLPPLQGGLRLARLAAKPIPPLSNQQQLSGGNASSGGGGGTYPPLLTSALNIATAANSGTLESNSSWLWKNFPDSNQYLLNGNGQQSNKMPHLAAGKPATATTTSSSSTSGTLKSVSGTGGGVSTLTLKQQQQQQKLIESAIMSKIPKSLTVIPQQMGADGSGGCGVSGNHHSSGGGGGTRE